MTTNVAIWRRRGEEAETEDHRAGNPPCVNKTEVYSALAAHFDGDLPTEKTEREGALDGAVEAYVAQAERRLVDRPRHWSESDAGTVSCG